MFCKVLTKTRENDFFVLSLRVVMGLWMVKKVVRRLIQWNLQRESKNFLFTENGPWSVVKRDGITYGVKERSKKMLILCVEVMRSAVAVHVSFKDLLVSTTAIQLPLEMRPKNENCSLPQIRVASMERTVEENAFVCPERYCLQT